MEDEIDLRKYIYVLLRHWKIIIGITAIAVILAVLYSFLVITPSYEAQAQLLITPAGAQQDKPTLVSLAKSSDVAKLVIQQLGDQMEPADRSVTKLAAMVGVGINGNIMAITVRSADPEKAAAYANAWATSYEGYLNGNLSVLQSQLGPLQVRADMAKKEYEERQLQWQDFAGNNSIDELSRKIHDIDLLCNVISLREQIEAGSSSPASAAANSLAIVLLQAGAFTTLPTGLQVSIDGLDRLNASTAQQLHDVDALISTLEARTGVQPGESISELQQEILQLRSSMEQQSAEKQEFQSARDIALQVYTTLHNTTAQLELASQSPDNLVKTVVTAAVPQGPLSAHKKTNMVIALVLGLVVGVFCAFGVEYFRNKREKPIPEKKRHIGEESEAEKRRE